MSTKTTLAYHDSAAGEPSWHFYEEVLESGVVYLELEGISAEMTTLELGGARVVLRLPTETARQLGLHQLVSDQRWEKAADPKKTEPLKALRGSGLHVDDPDEPR